MNQGQVYLFEPKPYQNVATASRNPLESLQTTPTPKNKHNQKETIVVEVKPYKETKEPIPQKNLTKKYLYEVKTWSINKSKWNYAIEYCRDRNWKFMILTEKELFKNGHSF